MMTSKRHILMPLTDAFGGFGGIAHYNRDVLQVMAAMPGIEQVIAIPRVITEQVGTIPSRVAHDKTAASGGLAFVARVLRHGLFGVRPDLIWCAHINYLPLCAIIAKLRGSPLILMIYGMETWLKPPSMLTRWALRHVTRIASISRFTLDQFAQVAPIETLPHAILPNAVDMACYGMAPKAADLVEKFGLAGRRVIMTLARMPENATKGFDVMLEAMPSVIAAAPDVIYLIGGRGEDARRLIEKVESLGISDHVIFAGEVPETRKADFYRLADLFAMPSSGDGFGFVFIEALACGVPVLASTIDGGYEAIMFGELGRAADPADIPSLSAQLIAGLGDAKGIPDRLKYYATTAFSERLQALISDVITSH